MKNRVQNLLYGRKTLYLVLAIVMISVFTLSIAYAAMSAVLEIHGNSEVVASSWDIHLDNIKVTSGSVNSEKPTISGNTTLSFNTTLELPGDFYEFTVDVVNDGSIDAVIDTVSINPRLSTQQARYIKREITYENGEDITSNQIIKKKTRTPIKIRIEYKKDIGASVLPFRDTLLSFEVSLIYVQSDGTGNEITNNGASTSLVNVVSGDGTQVGNEVCIKNECFYVISSTDSTVTMLSKYNLHVGYNLLGFDETGEFIYEEIQNPTGIQSSLAHGNSDYHDMPYIGVTQFSNINDSYSGSLVENYVNNYAEYLTLQGVKLVDYRIINRNDLLELGMGEDDNLVETPAWVYSSSYWVEYDSGKSEGGVYNRTLFLEDVRYDDFYYLGVRPVITISRDYL